MVLAQQKDLLNNSNYFIEFQNKSLNVQTRPVCFLNKKIIKNDKKSNTTFFSECNYF